MRTKKESTESNDMKIKKNENIVARKVHGSYFLVNITDNYSGDKCAIYEINETGIFIWNNIDGTYTVEDLAILLKDVIVDDVDYQIIYDDVAEFVDALVERHFAEV